MSRRLEARVIDALDAGGRVLVSRLQYLGDVILTLPMVQLLHERFPRAGIDYLARRGAADILVGEPLFDRVFDMSDGSLPSTWRLIRELRAREYSLAIDLYSNPRSAIAIRLSGARMRVGGSRRGRQRLYTHPMSVPVDVRAATRWHLAHLEPLGLTGLPTKPSLTISEHENKEALSTLTELGIDASKPVIGIHPGGKWMVKRWPADQFASLSEQLIDSHGMQILVMQGPGEEMYRDEVEGRLGKRARYLPTLPIRRTAAIVGALDGMVVSDGGIMHVSVAVGTPTVGVFGSAEPDVWFPYEEYGPYVAAWVPITCRPCHMHVCDHISCLRELTPAMVEEKLLGVLSRPSRSRGPVGL
jgi:lipopolysaccharide heptosyltransferase II